MADCATIFANSDGFVKFDVSAIKKTAAKIFSDIDRDDIEYYQDKIRECEMNDCG